MTGKEGGYESRATNESSKIPLKGFSRWLLQSNSKENENEEGDSEMIW